MVEIGEIDWNEYNIYFDEWSGRLIEHDVKDCHAETELVWTDLQEAIDWSLEHHKVCPLRA